jgi:hypothetical protein
VELRAVVQGECAEVIGEALQYGTSGEDDLLGGANPELSDDRQA